VGAENLEDPDEGPVVGVELSRSNVHDNQNTIFER